MGGLHETEQTSLITQTALGHFLADQGDQLIPVSPGLAWAPQVLLGKLLSCGFLAEAR